MNWIIIEILFYFHVGCWVPNRLLVLGTMNKHENKYDTMDREKIYLSIIFKWDRTLWELLDKINTVAKQKLSFLMKNIWYTLDDDYFKCCIIWLSLHRKLLKLNSNLCIFTYIRYGNKDVCCWECLEDWQIKKILNINKFNL